MQNSNFEQKQNHPIRNGILLLAAAGMLIYIILFAIEVFSIRSQILSGEYNLEDYGVQISGTGGANYDQSGTYNVATSDDPALGPEDAKVTIVEFSDFECPFCRQSYPTIRSLTQEFRDEVRFIYRDFPLVTIHENAHAAARAGYCADTQGLFWQLHDKLFQNQDNLGKTAILGYANQIGADSAAFAACLDSPEAYREVDADIAAGEAAGVQGTPTWFINGIRVAGVIPEDVFRQIIIELAK